MPEFSHLSVEAVREAKHFQELKTVYLERLLAFRRASTYETTSFHCFSFMLVRLSGSLERLESLLLSSSSMTASRYISFVEATRGCEELLRSFKRRSPNTVLKLGWNGNLK
jgi:hypothetical protein